MDQNALTDTELVVLSLICEQPLHGYQIEQLISDRNMGAWTEISTSSIYYVLKKLEEQDWIEPIPTPSPSTQGAPRKVYRITKNGEQIWKEATLQALSNPRITYTNFLMGLHNLWKIPAGEAFRAVQTYQNWLRADLERQREAYSQLAAVGLSGFPVDELFEYGFVLGDAELAFLEDLLERLAVRSKETGESKT